MVYTYSPVKLVKLSNIPSCNVWSSLSFTPLYLSLKKKLQKSRLKQSILSSTIGRPANSQLRSPLKAASIRSLPACEGMTDVLSSTHYSNTYFKNYSDVHCQAWRKMIPGQFPNGIWRLHGNPFPHSCTDKKKSRNW